MSTPTPDTFKPGDVVYVTDGMADEPYVSTVLPATSPRVVYVRGRMSGCPPSLLHRTRASAIAAIIAKAKDDIEQAHTRVTEAEARYARLVGRKMKMSESTKGPWEWREMGSWCLIGNHGMRPVVLATRRFGNRGEFQLRDAVRDLLIPFDPDHPDARLIEAAPDLLDACKALVDALHRYEWKVEKDAPPEHLQMMESARSAIAKATGATP